MEDEGRAKRLYLELTALLIEREIEQFRCGEKSAFASFTNIARLAGNVTEESCGFWRPQPSASPGGRSAQADDGEVHRIVSPPHLVP